MSTLQILKTLTILTLLFGMTVSGFPTPLGKPQRDDAAPQPGRRKLALLVGISKYQRGIKNDRSLDDLHATNDIEAIASVLIERFQFRLDDIQVLSDLPVQLAGRTISATKPTHKAIVKSFHEFLIKQTKPGDIVFFYFVGHGSSVPDNGTDELDGYDETLVPFDYSLKMDGSNDIRDDELGDLLDELGAKAPANVTIAIDSCFSGTVTRGDYDVVRGLEWKGTPVPREKVRGEDESLNDWTLQRGTARKSPLRNYVFLSASSSRQPAVETPFCSSSGSCETYGVFSHALAGALDAAGPTTTYRDIHESVVAEASRGLAQRPQIEGDQRDHLVFQDGALPAESFVPVKVDEYGIVLSAGSLQGITVGSRFALYPRETKSRSEGPPLAEGRITDVRARRSSLEVTGSVPPATLKNAARAFELFHNYESILKVALKDVGNNAGIMQSLKELGLVSTVPESSPEWNVLIRAVVPADRDEHLVPTDFQGVILQRRSSQSIVARIEVGPNLSERIKRALISEAKRLTLLTLEDTAADIRVEMRLIPVELDWHLDPFGHGEIDKVKGDKSEGLRYSKGGLIEFKLDEWYRVELRNPSESDVYITILNLDANGQISPSFPKFDKNNLLKSTGRPKNKDDGWLPIEEFFVRVTKPLGLESLRVIATKEQTDFSPLFDPGIIARGEARGDSFTEELMKQVRAIRDTHERGSESTARKLETAIKSPLGQIFIAAQEGRGTRGESANMPPPSWSTAVVSYVVKE